MLLVDCHSAVLGSFLYFTKNILNLIWIIGPILAMISLIINFLKMMRDPEDKKTPKKIQNSFIALAVLFLIPTIVNIVMLMVDDRAEISACWNADIDKPDYNSTYINPYGDETTTPIYSDPTGYDPSIKKDSSEEGTYNDQIDMPVTSCGNLEYCNKFLTSMYNNSKRLSDAIARNNAPVEYNYHDHKKTWALAIQAAEQGKLVATTCVVPTNWGLTDVLGKTTVVNSVGYGGFQGYKGKLTNYTKQYKFDCKTTVKDAIRKGWIQPGDVIGVHAHTFSIYSVNQKTGSAVVFDGGHRFTNKCKKSKCSTMMTYSASANNGMKLCQLIRWVK